MSLLCVLANVQPFVRLKFTFSHLCAQSDGGASLLWELSVTAREVSFPTNSWPFFCPNDSCLFVEGTFIYGPEYVARFTNKLFFISRRRSGS